jgi:hypothetical protein
MPYSVNASGAEQPHVAYEAFERLQVWLDRFWEQGHHGEGHDERHTGRGHFAELLFRNAFLKRQQMLCPDAIGLIQDLPPAILAQPACASAPRDNDCL